MSARSRRWDIFCKVVDNFGDAGVSWRLARQLANEHAIEVTLWLDDLAALGRIAPGASADRAQQRVDGVTVRRADDPAGAAEPADVVIEAFGCGLPEAYVAAMAARTVRPQWFVLEYLSAEPWVEASHGLASPHPRLPLARTFWFPGFTARTGGLLRERGLGARRDAFRADDAAVAALWSALRIPPPVSVETRVSLFCYPNPALPSLLDAWADGDAPVVCVVPEGVAAGSLDVWAGGSVPHAGGAPLRRGRLAVHAMPFVDQDTYDRVLWACDVNFVRGEDSFVRAQWAARPFVWHIYAQAERAHVAKLAAFLDRYAARLAPPVAGAVRTFMGAWNGDSAAGDMGPAWPEFADACRELTAHGMEWAEDLARLPDLAAGLVKAAEGGV